MIPSDTEENDTGLPLKMKANAEPISFVTAYDYPMATFAERDGLDMILVGDSVGMVVYGYEKYTAGDYGADDLSYGSSGRRGAPNTFGGWRYAPWLRTSHLQGLPF